MAPSAAYVLAATVIASSTTAFVPMGGEHESLGRGGENMKARCTSRSRAGGICGAASVRQSAQLRLPLLCVPWCKLQWEVG